MATSRQLDTNAPAVFHADISDAAKAVPWSISGAWKNVPLFWKFQITGWAAHGVITFPLKFFIFDSLATCVLTTLIAQSVGIIQTSYLRIIYRRLALRLERPRRLVMSVFICCAVAALIDWLIAQPVNRMIRADTLTTWVLFGMTWNHALAYVMWTFLYFWIKSAMAARERAVNLVRAESAAREAELQMLRAQINPHFLFNSLNTVLAGLHEDQQALAGVVQGLADYLRYSLAHRHATTVPLGEEFDAVMNYLLVEKARFRDDLKVEAHIDKMARTLPVPGVMLQPLVENAVKYGYKSSPLPLRLRIRIRAAANGGATVEVANSGEWIEPPAQRHPGDAGGVGLESLTRRLSLLYPGTHHFEISKTGGEVAVRIQVPRTAFKTASA